MDKRMTTEEVAKLLNIKRYVVYQILERLHVNYIDASDLVSHGKVLLNEEQVELIKNNLQNEDTPAKKEKSKKKHRISNNYLGQVAKIVGMSYWTVLLYARKAGWTTGKRKETQFITKQFKETKNNVYSCEK